MLFQPRRTYFLVFLALSSLVVCW